MNITLKDDFTNSSYYVKPFGRIDVNTAIEFGTTVSNAVDDNDVKNLVIDFEEVPYISSMGLRVLLELQRKMNDLGSMKLKNVNQEVMDIFKMTGFDKILVFDN